MDRVEVSRGYDMNIFDEIWYCLEISYHVELYPPNSVPSSRAFSISISSLTVAFRDRTSLNHRWSEAAGPCGMTWHHWNLPRLITTQCCLTEYHLVCYRESEGLVLTDTLMPNPDAFCVDLTASQGIWLASFSHILPSYSVCWGFET